MNAVRTDTLSRGCVTVIVVHDNEVPFLRNLLNSANQIWAGCQTTP
jgi:hypothetical protein